MSKYKDYINMFMMTQSPGLNWYRVVQFSDHLNKIGVKSNYWPDHKPDENLLPNWEAAMLGNKDLMITAESQLITADTIVYQRVSSAVGFAFILGIRDRYPQKKIFCEIDDNAFDIDASNPAVKTVRPDSDPEYWFKKQLGIVDGVITSTEALKKLYKPFNKKIHIIKNSIDFKYWDQFKKKKTPNKKIQIAWQGAWHHEDDLSILAGVIPKVLKKHKNVEFHLFGHQPDYLKDITTYHPMVPITKYAKMMVKANPDIILAPLVDTKFNRCKSNLRVLEAGAMRTAVIASGNKHLPYYNTIQDLDTGLLVNKTDEWVDAIGKLIENKELREKLGDNLYKMVKKNYNIKDTAKKYKEILTGVKT